MRIILINTFYYPNIIGGTENSVRLLAENLVLNGHKVLVFSADGGKESKREKINGVEIYRCSSKRYLCRQRIGVKIINKIIELRNYSIKKEINKIIDEFKPDIIHTNNIYRISPYIWKCIKKRNIKIVHTVRDYWIIDSKSNLNNNQFRFSKKIYQQYFKSNIRNIDYVTAPSKFTLDVVEKYGYLNEKIEKKSISNAIKINEQNLKDILSEKRKKTSEIINFMFVGNLDYIKGVDKMLNSFFQIDNEHIRLNIFGDGRLEKMVREYEMKDARIKYYGKLKKEDLEKEYKKNDVLMVPSMWDEPFGRVVIEANQYGVVVIGSNRGGIKEIIEATKSGELFECEKISEFEKLIKYFSNRNNIKKYYGNIERNLGRYSIMNQIEEFTDIYLKLVNNKNRDI